MSPSERIDVLSNKPLRVLRDRSGKVWIRAVARAKDLFEPVVELKWN